MTSHIEIWNILTAIIQIITMIGLIIVLYWQRQDRKIKGANIIIPEARIALIQRIKNNTGQDDLPREEALKLDGIFQIKFFLINVGDRNGFVRFNKVYVNSSGTNFELHEKPRESIYETHCQTHQQIPTSKTFAIPKRVWFNKKGDLIIEAEYFDSVSRIYKPQSFKIPLTTGLRYD